MGSQETWGKTPTVPVPKPVGDGSGPRGAPREGYSTCETAPLWERARNVLGSGLHPTPDGGFLWGRRVGSGPCVIC